MDENTNGSYKTRNIIIGVVVVLLVAGGISAYLYNQDQQNKKEAAAKAATAAAAQAAANSQTNTTKTAVFGPATTDGVPFVATTKTTQGDKSITGVMTHDAEGNVSYAYQAAGKNMTVTYTKDAYYICTGTTCLKYNTTDTANSGFDPSAYEFDGSRVAELKNTAAYKGQEACPAPATGTCDVWSVTQANGAATVTMYVNTETKRMAKVTTVTGTTSSEATYDYKSATVTIPTNARTVNGTPTPAPTT